MNQAQIFHIRKAEGHRRVAIVIRRDAQPFFHLGGTIDRAHQEAVEATSKSQGMSHQRAMIDGHGAVERRARVPGFSVAEYYDGGIVEEAVFALLHLLVRILHLRKGVTNVFCSSLTGDQRQ